jgi:hypothetical protein
MSPHIVSKPVRLSEVRRASGDPRNESERAKTRRRRRFRPNGGAPTARRTWADLRAAAAWSGAGRRSSRPAAAWGRAGRRVRRGRSTRGDVRPAAAWGRPVDQRRGGDEGRRQAPQRHQAAVWRRRVGRAGRPGGA